MAALRIQQDQVSYLYGSTIWEGVEALVPRALWPDKPVYGGSGHIVADMTGLHLDEDTSWGVGNVMEFQINFGTPGVVIGFLILGFLIGWLDYQAALADYRGDLGNLIMFFLPGLALIQPNGSIVEVSGGAAAAAVAAYLWKWAWISLAAANSGPGPPPGVRRVAMKVLLAVKSFLPSYGGPAFSVSRLAVALADAGITVGLWASDMSATKTPLLPTHSRIRPMAGAVAEAIDDFGGADILHDNGIWLPHNHRLAALAAKRKLTRVVSIRGMLDPWAINHKKLKKKAAWWLYQRRDLCRASYHHATAVAEAENLQNLRLGVPVGVIPNGVDVANVDRREQRHAPRINTALFLGRIHPVKGLSLLLEAWARLGRPTGDYRSLDLTRRDIALNSNKRSLQHRSLPTSIFWDHWTARQRSAPSSMPTCSCCRAFPRVLAWP